MSLLRLPNPYAVLGARQVMDTLRPYIEQALALAAARRADAREEAAALQALAERQRLGRCGKRDAGHAQAAAPAQGWGAGRAGAPGGVQMTGVPM